MKIDDKKLEEILLDGNYLSEEDMEKAKDEILKSKELLVGHW